MCVSIIPVKFLEVIKPFCSILPEIAKPERKVSQEYIFTCTWFLGIVSALGQLAYVAPYGTRYIISIDQYVHVLLTQKSKVLLLLFHLCGAGDYYVEPMKAS